jgi:large subunit ribosomal protein L30
MGISERGTRNPEFGTGNSALGTQRLERGSRNKEFGTLNWELRTQDSAHGTRKRQRMAKEIRVTLVRSMAGRPEKHRKILRGLGLTRMHKTVTLHDTPQIMGAVQKVRHMVTVSEVQ